MKRKPYREGDWFAVPLNSGYVLGRIARAGRRGGILLGYFFEPPRDTVPTPEDTSKLTPGDAFYVTKFCDPGLEDGEWPIVYRPDHWNRSEWPMPPLGRIDAFHPGRGYAVLYDENDLSDCRGEWRITVEQALQLPEDGQAGHIYLQRRLEKYFREGHRPYDPTDRRRLHSWLHGLPDPNAELLTRRCD